MIYIYLFEIESDKQQFAIGTRHRKQRPQTSTPTSCPFRHLLFWTATIRSKTTVRTDPLIVFGNQIPTIKSKATPIGVPFQAVRSTSTFFQNMKWTALFHKATAEKMYIQVYMIIHSQITSSNYFYI